MKIKCIASTHVGYTMTKEGALRLGGKAAGVCYMAGTMDDILYENSDKTMRRVGLTLGSGHHSVYEHAQFTLYLEGIPKILAMILNNEKQFSTSEKSARYTKMKIEGKEKELYDKWVEKLENIIKFTYTKMPAAKAKKMAMENARYFISVFTPSTNMMYTCNFRQINYILHWCEDYIANEPETDFTLKVKAVLKDFLAQMQYFYVPEMNCSQKPRKLSLFDDKKRKEQWGEVYCVNYEGSLAYLAQAQRHRTISYSMSFPQEPKFYVPEILWNTEGRFEPMKDIEEWQEDMRSIAGNYPQGLLVNICERGTVENLINKAYERLCGQAQLEIMRITSQTIKRFILEVECTYPDIHDELKRIDVGSRCNFGWECNEPCFFGKKAFDRKV